jgi:hypothetical protein
MTAVYASKQVTISSGGIKKVYSTMVSGAIVSISDCSWQSQSQYNIYSPPYTGVRNNCGDGGSGNTITVNDGGAYSFSGTTSPVTSYISQADADSQAQTAAQSNFNAGIQAYINANAGCNWTYNGGSCTYPATNYTRNNCGSGCTPSTITYGQVTKTGYSASSTSSYQNAVDSANAAACSAASSESQTLGQAYANSVGTCCCWVPASACNGCNYMDNREVNTCTGEYRNTTPTQYGVCGCGQSCQGTYYGNSYCSGADSKNRTYYEVYNCTGASTGASYEVNCGCNDGMTDRQSTNQTTCIGCTNVTIYLDVNRCSSTAGHYFVNGVDQGTTMPSTTACYTGTDYSAYKGVYCYSGTNYDVYEDTNHTCSQQTKYQLRNRFGDVQGYNDNLGSSACQFSAYRSGTFTRNDCPSGYTAGSVSYSNTYYYTGIKNQDGADEIANANFNNDGQNYANANGSCTAPPVCYTYNIISNNSGVNVTGNYTTCGGSSSSFSFFSSSSFTQVGTICAQAGTVSSMSNGFSSSNGGC